MKKIVILLLATYFLSGNSIYKKNGKVVISSNTEACSVKLDSRNRVIYSSCKILTNSNNIKIFCTKHKKVCKTIYEVSQMYSSNNFQRCYDNAIAGSELRNCISKELNYYDKQLNRVYKKAMRVLPKYERNKLRTSERVWIKYRDTKCDSEAGAMRGGTGEITLYGSCLIDVTKKRIKFIKDIMVQNQ